MKFQRSTLILMTIALGLGGYVYLFEVQQTFQQQNIQVREKQIFSFDRNQVQVLTVTTPEQTIIVERISEEEPTEQSPWRLTQPVQNLANQATVDFLLNQLVTDQSIPQDPTIGLRRLTISPEELPQYGLDTPQKTVKVQLKNQETYQLNLGTKDFSNRGVYAQTNPSQASEETLSILVIPEGILSAITRPVEEWQLIETEPQALEEQPETLMEPENNLDPPLENPPN